MSGGQVRGESEDKQRAIQEDPPYHSATTAKPNEFQDRFLADRRIVAVPIIARQPFKSLSSSRCASPEMTNSGS
jgi:hypothetical protein